MNMKMKAILQTRTGPPEVLTFGDIPRPQPKEDEVLIKIHASTVTIGDVLMRRLHPLLIPVFRLFGMRRIQIPGTELAGEVAAVGRDVTKFKVGDQVYGTTTGLSAGGNAEYICLPQTWRTGVLARKPANLTFEEAAALPVGGMTALHLLRKAQIKPGQKVLVYGASGSVGTFAVQLARAFGAEVVGVCSTANLELVRGLGASTVIDYTASDFSLSGQTYDVVFDAVGKLPAAKARAALNKGGKFLSVRTPTSEKIEYLDILRDLCESGKIAPVIDRRYPLEQVVDAHHYVQTGRKRGNVAISITSRAGEQS